MSRVSMNTGSITFTSSKALPKKVDTSDPDRPCHLIVLSDFSARDHRGLSDASGIADRKIIEVDRDNFDEVFARLKPQLDIPIADEPIQFSELDDLHPDFIYDKVPLFEKFRRLKSRLKNNATFDDAAAEIAGWMQSADTAETAEETQPPAVEENSEQRIEEGAELLDQLLGSSTSRQTGALDVQHLIKDIIAPYVTPGPDPRQEDLLKTVDESASHLMRKIMHAPAFQNLESAWRGLYLLARRLETDKHLRIFIVDVSQKEVIDDCLSAESVEQSALNKLLVEKRTATGANHFNLIVGDYCFRDQLEDVLALHTMGQIAESIDASFVANGAEQLAGCDSLANTPDKDDWAYQLEDDFSAQWTELRQSSAAQRVALSSPKVLLRMPYGKRTSKTDSFDFEELPPFDKHGFYLWGNGSWLISLLLAQHYTEFRWNFNPGQINEVDRLPLHVYTEDDESVVTPCAEILMTDSVAGALSDAGLMVIRSVSGKDSVMIPKFRSLSDDEANLLGSWGM